MDRAPRFDFNAASAAAKAGLDTLWAKPKRSQTILLVVGAGVLIITFLSVVLSSRAAVLILDQSSTGHFFYAFTFQTVMHIVVFVGLGDLFVRWRSSSRGESLR